MKLLNSQKLSDSIFNRIWNDDLTFRAAADQSGVPSGTLYRVYKGKEPSIETYFKLCVWLEVSADNFLNAPGAQEVPK